jgi:hypothetical protein
VEFDIREMLKTIANRAVSGNAGIAPASFYLKSLVPCLAGDNLCPTKIFELASSDLWEKELSDSENRLTYYDPASEIDQKSVKTSGLELPNAIMEFDGKLITAEKDREGDIFDVKGVSVDPQLPVLWSHIQLQPIGRITKTISHDDEKLVLKHVLLDVALGRDAAVLIEGKALRLSPGFIVRDAEPLTRSKNAAVGEPFGWRIKKSDLLESSPCAVPANAGAIITAYEKKKFEHPLTNSFAKLLDQHRTKSFAVPADVPPAAPAEAKTLETKTVEVETKMIGCDGFIPGSYESITSNLTRTAPDFLRSKNIEIDRHDAWCYMVATFTSDAIVCCYGSRKCYRASYEVKDDKAQWSGDPKEVEIKPTVIEKSLESFIQKTLDTKAGRVLSKLNADKLTAVRDAIDDLLKSAGTDEKCGDDMKKDGEKHLVVTAESATRALLAKSIELGGDAGYRLLDAAHKTLGGMIAHANEQREAAELNSFMAGIEG